MSEELFEDNIYTEDITESTASANATTIDIDGLIEKFKNTDLDLLKRNAKKSGISLDDLKNIADHLNMSKYLPKPKLVEEIKKKLDNKDAITKIAQSNQLSSQRNAVKHSFLVS